jgi:hypothetical protein
VRIQNILDVIRAGVALTLYPNDFPATATDDCATVTLSGGGEAKAVIQRPSIQVKVRAKDPATAEAKAWEVFNFLNNKRNFDVGTFHVVLSTAQQATPLYIGTDANGRFLYSINFSTITEVLN